MGCGLLGRGASTTLSLSRTPCLISIGLITKGCSLRHPCHSLVQQILAFRDVYTSMQWNHTIREANRVADTLANMAFRWRINTVSSIWPLPFWICLYWWIGIMLASRVICNCFLWCLAPFCHIKKYIAYVENLKKKNT